ncbi:Mediator of RNA polymerase II transcription subunit 25 [Abeliophyllum distichum]|uniref:Mediator of RNA polymerase II transcription subunit 25 n=1 Tax=Abeliophyllum distichum TaxID=126358 RepID=A0ABD1U113_9LAMI
MRNRFRSSQEGSLEERFLALRQEGSVREYRLLFETLTAPIEDVSDAMLEGHFINGLSPEVQAEQIMELAQRIEMVGIIGQNTTGLAITYDEISNGSNNNHTAMGS